jgi:hypothetical protein
VLRAGRKYRHFGGELTVALPGFSPRGAKFFGSKRHDGDDQPRPVLTKIAGDGNLWHTQLPGLQGSIAVGVKLPMLPVMTFKTMRVLGRMR